MPIGATVFDDHKTPPIHRKVVNQTLDGFIWPGTGINWFQAFNFTQKGATPLASNRDTSNGPDWRDVAAAAKHFAREWEAEVKIWAELRTCGSQPHIVWIAEARELGVKTQEAKCLGSASVSMLTRGAGGTDAVLLLLLYELDRDIYRNVIGVSGNY